MNENYFKKYIKLKINEFDEEGWCKNYDFAQSMVDKNLIEGADYMYDCGRYDVLQEIMDYLNKNTKNIENIDLLKTVYEYNNIQELKHYVSGLYKYYEDQEELVEKGEILNDIFELTKYTDELNDMINEENYNALKEENIKLHQIINELKIKNKDLKQGLDCYEHLLIKRDSIKQEICMTCHKYTKAELMTNDRALGRAEVADEILEIMKGNNNGTIL